MTAAVPSARGSFFLVKKMFKKMYGQLESTSSGPHILQLENAAVILL